MTLLSDISKISRCTRVHVSLYPGTRLSVPGYRKTNIISNKMKFTQLRFLHSVITNEIRRFKQNPTPEKSYLIEFNTMNTSFAKQGQICTGYREIASYIFMTPIWRLFFFCLSVIGNPKMTTNKVLPLPWLPFFL